MQVTARLHHIQTKENDVRLVELRDSATIDDLFIALDIHLADVECERYYRVQNYSLRLGESTLQYILSSGGMQWNPSYRDTRLEDFFSTHDISDCSIHVRYERGGRGGGFIDYLLMWDQVYSVLEHSVTMLTGAGFAYKLFKFANGLMRKRRPPGNMSSMSPGNLLSLIGQRNQWNAFDLGTQTQMSPEQARFFLKGCGYRFDKHQQLFVATDATEHFFDLINSTEFKGPAADFNASLDRNKWSDWFRRLIGRKQ